MTLVVVVVGGGGGGGGGGGFCFCCSQFIVYISVIKSHVRCYIYHSIIIECSTFSNKSSNK